MVQSLRRGQRPLLAIVLVAGLVALIVTVEPVRLALHTVLNGLRVTPLEIKPETATPSPAAPAAAQATLQPDTFVVTEVEPSRWIESAGPDELANLPFEALTIDRPPEFAAPPERQVWIGGESRVAVDFGKLAEFLSASEVRVPLPPSLRQGDVEIRGGAMLINTWPSARPESAPLVLMQIKPPSISGPPQLDLELIVDALLREVLPPVVSRQTRAAEVPLIRDALGLPGSESPVEPRAFNLPDGPGAVAWSIDGVTVVLAGQFDSATLLRLAESARSV